MVTYFCLPDGTVLNAIAGPVTAKEFLKEARWTVETRKAGLIETKGVGEAYDKYFQQAHAERYYDEFVNKGQVNQVIIDPRTGKILAQGNANAQGKMVKPLNRKVPTQRPTWMPNSGQVQWLLAYHSRPKISEIYKTVYQDILRERISNLPVLEQ